MKPDDTTFKILLIASEIIIPLIAFVGAYFIFKPVFEKDKAKKEKDESAEKSETNQDAS
jgi:phosphate/sulfate permease